MAERPDLIVTRPTEILIPKANVAKCSRHRKADEFIGKRRDGLNPSRRANGYSRADLRWSFLTQCINRGSHRGGRAYAAVDQDNGFACDVEWRTCGPANLLTTSKTR